MTLSDLWPHFKVTTFSEVKYRKNNIKTKLLLHNRKRYLTCGMVLCLVTLTDLQMRRTGLSASAELFVLQAGCLICHPTNSVRALKEDLYWNCTEKNLYQSSLAPENFQTGPKPCYARQLSNANQTAFLSSDGSGGVLHDLCRQDEGCTAHRDMCQGWCQQAHRYNQDVATHWNHVQFILSSTTVLCPQTSKPRFLL